MKAINYISALCAAVLLLSLSPGRTAAQPVERNDSTIVKKARYVAGVAQRDLSLTDAETSFLEDTFYDRYYAGEQRTKDVSDPAKVAEIKSSIHKEFSRVVYKHYGHERSAEIIAWYYNYSNKKR